MRRLDIIVVTPGAMLNEAGLGPAAISRSNLIARREITCGFAMSA